LKYGLEGEESKSLE